MQTKDNNKIAKQKAKEAHEFLKKFITNFDKVKRGGIHDFMETLIAMMILASVDKIDAYLKPGHQQVNANEVMAITLSSFQGVLDNAKRNLESMKEMEMV